MTEPEFKKDDVVIIYTKNGRGETFIEGRAKVVRATHIPNQYQVRFMNDKSRKTVRRFIADGISQHDPEGFLDRANCKSKFE